MVSIHYPIPPAEEPYAPLWGTPSGGSEHGRALHKEIMQDADIMCAGSEKWAQVWLKAAVY